jgi:hypothetical protein
MDMCLLIKSMWFEWHMYFLISEFDWKFLFDHLSNWTYNQVEQNIDNLTQNGEKMLIKWDI